MAYGGKLYIFSYGCGIYALILPGMFERALCRGGERKEKKTGKKIQCVLTGGDSTQLSDKLHIPHLLEPALVLKGMAIIGTCFAVAIGKMVFGGLGANIFNPAMAGYVVVLVAFGFAVA